MQAEQIVIKITQQNIDDAREAKRDLGVNGDPACHCPIAQAFMAIGYTEVFAQRVYVRTAKGNFRQNENSKRFMSLWDAEQSVEPIEFTFDRVVPC